MIKTIESGKSGGGKLIQVRAVSPFGMVNYYYVLVDQVSGTAVAIDPAWDQGALRDVLRICDSKLVGVLLTHSHPDHTHLASNVAAEYGCQVYISKVEADYYGFKALNQAVFEPSVVLQLEAFQIEAIATPGHTKGSTCFRIEGNVFTGDTLFAEGCGICVGPGADPIEMFQSLQMLKKKIVMGDRIFPGHSFKAPPGQRFSYLLEHNVYLQFDQSDMFSKFRMRPAQSGLYDFK